MVASNNWTATSKSRRIAANNDGFATNGFAFPSYYTGTYGTPTAASSLQALTQTGANAVELSVTQYVSNASATTIQSTADTDSDANLLAEIAQATSDGLHVFLAPHLNSEDGTWSAQLTPSDIGQFFANYQTFIVHYAQLAQQAGVALFAIGNEMGALTGSQYLPYWTSIIAAVRQVYSGKLTYDSAWNETGSVSFWNQLDVIGANAYTPPTTITNPSVSQLAAGWTSVSSNSSVASAMNNMSPLAFYQSLASTYDKPVLFTEIGYQAVNGTNLLAGASPGANNYTDFQQQANALQAFLQVLSQNKGTWFNGAYLWDWNPYPSQVNPNDFSVQSKPALNVVDSYFQSGGTSPAASPNTLNGNSNSVTLADGVSASVSGTGNMITLGNSDSLIVTGASDTLTLTGANDTASLSNGAVIAAPGSQVSVTANGITLSSDTVTGNGDTLVLSGGAVTLVSGIAASVQGDYDIIAGGSSDFLMLTGTADTASFIGSGDDIYAGGNAVVEMSNGNMSVYDGNAVTLSGTNDTIGMNGSTLTLEDDSQVALVGNGGTLLMGNNDTIDESNGSNRTFVASGTGDSLALDATYGTTLTLSGGTVTFTNGLGSTVNGNNDTIALSGGGWLTATGNSDVITASGTGEQITVSGNSDSLTFSGTSDTLTVSGGSIIAGTDSAATISGVSDTLQFGPNISIDQLWFAQQGQDLDVSVIGTTETMTISNWSSSGSAGWIFATSDGHTLASSQVANLVNAMAGLTQPSLGQTTLPNTQPYQNLETTIAANWQG